MSIINLVWRTFALFVCSIIQMFSVLIEGIARILFKTVKYLNKAWDRVFEWGAPKTKEKKAHIDIPL